MAMKIVMSTKTNVRKLVEDPIKFYGHERDFQLVHEDNVDEWVKIKLQSGHECAIFSLEQFAYNELIPTFTKP